MLNELYVSPDFTIEDIRRIRDYNSARHSKMTTEEVIADYKKGADKVVRLLAERKAKSAQDRAI